MMEGGRNTESVVDTRIVLCRHVRNSARLEKGDKLTAPDIEKEVPEASTFFDLYRVGDDRLEPQHPLVKLTGLVQVKRRQPNVGKSSMTHGYSSRWNF